MVTDQDLQILDSVFKVLDVDCDGSLTKEEFAKADKYDTQSKGPQVWDTIFDLIDSDKNKWIDFQ